MPLYEYRCTSCGHQEEFLQKLSDAPLSVCTACGKETFSKMLTAAGFQLKGSGWYATDFKNSGSKPAPRTESKNTESKSTDSIKTDSAKTDSVKGDSAKTDSPKTETKGDGASKKDASSPPASGGPAA
jgi:putative FmdB family regulatory protein